VRHPNENPGPLAVTGEATATSAGRKVVMLRNLRFRPANSNDAARAQLAHHFAYVPKCSYARDDGISLYLGSQTGMDTAPASPKEHVALHRDVPDIAPEPVGASKKRRFKLLRDAFATALLLHAVAAAAMLFVSVPVALDDAQIEGETVISLVVEGDIADQVSAGEQDAPDEPEDDPVEVEIKTPIATAVEKPVEPVKRPEPQPAKTEEILKDLPMPALTSDLLEILTARDTADTKTEAAAAPMVEERPVEEPVQQTTAVIPDKPVETPVEPKPVVKPEPIVSKVQPLAHPVSRPRVVEKAIEKPKPVEKKPEETKPELKKEEPKKPEPKKKPEKKDKPVEKHRKKGNKADAAITTRKGADDSKRKGKNNSNESLGASNNRELGNAAKSNYQGLVQKKLQRAKGRVRSPGKGTAVVTFTIAASGGISGLRLTKSSGNPKTDAAALKIVNSAAPFPAIPTATGRKSWQMRVPIQFK